MLDNHPDDIGLKTRLPDDLAAGLKPLPAGITPSENIYIAPLTTRDYRVENPMDQAAVDKLIYDIVCQERATMATGARLYIIMGEHHAKPSHKMAQAGVIDNLAADRDTHGSVMLALETPYNQLQQYLDDVYKTRIPEPLKTSFHERDPLGHHFARTVLADNMYTCAPQSMTRVLSRALTHNLPIALCDAARKEFGYLDPGDDMAQEIARSARFQCDLANEDISVVGTRGMNTRNAVMARRAVEKAQDNKADTVVIQTGLNHLGGNLSRRLNYDTSLTALLKDQIRPQDRVLSVFFSSAVNNYAPERIVSREMWQDNPDHIIIRNLCDHKPPKLVFSNYLEKRLINRLGDSYLAQEFGGEVPDRFQTLELPSPESVRAEALQLIQDNTP